MGPADGPRGYRILAGHATAVLEWNHRYPWRSTAVAGGAIPANMSGLPTHQAVGIPRCDSALWYRLRRPDVGYGGYGIRSPIVAAATRRAPLPNVRYTADTGFWIYRWPRTDHRGEHGIYGLRRALTELEQQTVALQAQLTERGDQLAAARAANRELMTQMNTAR